MILYGIVFVVLFFASYFCFQDDIDVEEAKILLIISAFLGWHKKSLLPSLYAYGLSSNSVLFNSRYL